MCSRLKSQRWSPRKCGIFLAALLFSCLSFLAHVPAIAQEAKKILIVYSYHTVFPWTRLWRTGFEEEFPKQISRLGIGVQVFDEYMDSVRFKNNEPYFKTYLQSKYQKQGLDLILAVDSMAASFITDCRRELFPDIPLLIFTDEPWLRQHQIPEKAALIVSSKVSIGRNLELILKLQPDTRKIVFVTGTSAESQERKEAAKHLYGLRLSRKKPLL